MNNLSPCPFCKQEAHFIERPLIKEEFDYRKDVFYDVGCLTENCSMKNGSGYWVSKDKARELWESKIEENR